MGVMADEWVTCEICGDRMKADRLDAHVDEVHPGGATSPEERQRIEQRKQRRRKLVVGAVAVLAVAGLVAGGYVLTQLGGRTPATLDPSGEPRIGSADANLTVYLFEDYQCPHCQRFELGGAFDHLRETWVDTGEVQLVFKDFAFIGDDSTTAAIASQCTWTHAPDAWLSWHAMVFENQGRERSGWASAGNLKAMTEDQGKVNMTRFEGCLDGRTFSGEVSGDMEEGRANGVSGTPSLVVGNRVINPTDTDRVDQAIRAALRGE